MTVYEKIKTHLPDLLYTCTIHFSLIKYYFLQLMGIESEPEREQFLVDHGEWLIDQGIPNVWRLTVEKRMEFAGLLVKQFVYYRYISN